MGARFVAAALLVLAALVPYGVATWSYWGMLGVVRGRVVPGGVVQAFNIDVGTLYAGMARTVEANATLYMPDENVVSFYGVPVLNVTSPRTYPPLNETMGFNYSVVVYIDGEYRGVVSNDENLTIVLSPGEHVVKAIITIWAPPISVPADLQLYIYIEAESTG